ncbi:MAG: phytanoyl-CoA dioxygenase family protein [Fimbriimonadaceae bacterium]
MATGLGGLPDLDPNYDVPGDAKNQFQEKGWTKLENVCTTDEVAAYREIIKDTAVRHVNEDRPLEERDTYGKAFLQVTNLWQKDERVAKFVLAKRFAKIAADLMGVEGVRLYHDQALFKEPGGGHTPWHQDQYYWPLEGVKTVTMWMPLVDVDKSMMAMKFAENSHHDGSLVQLEISDESEEFFNNLVKEKGYNVEQVEAMGAGDATWHTGWTLHAAPGNATERMREVMTIIYYEDGAEISEPDSEARKLDLKTWFPGQKPGEKAGSPINPLLYSRG